MHPASIRAISDFWDALSLERLSLGLVHPQPGSDRGNGWWQTDLLRPDFIRALARAAAANVAGAHVYVRVPTATANHHCGVILLDDVDRGNLNRLTANGWEACAVVETSPSNFQAWLRLVPPDTVLDQESAKCVLRELIDHYGADPRAASPMQPGRLVGYTNRKTKYADRQGRFPFVRLAVSRPGVVCSAAPAALERLHSQHAQAGAPRAATPETPRAASPNSSAWLELDSIRKLAQARISFELQTGLRDPQRASQSEVDWLTVMQALGAGFDSAEIAVWLHAARPERGVGYAQRTVNRALESCHGRSVLRP